MHYPIKVFYSEEDKGFIAVIPVKTLSLSILVLDFIGGPNGIRTRVLALRGPRPGPLDDGTFKRQLIVISEQ